MRIKLLGTGTSTGVPELGCACEVCTSADVRDKRLRSSALIEDGDTHILIDCGPDFRMQMLNEPFHKIDAFASLFVEQIMIDDSCNGQKRD